MKKLFKSLIITVSMVMLLSCAAYSEETHAGQLTPESALKMLMDGNTRFSKNLLTHPDQTEERRKVLIDGQHPFAVVICCSDSRVAPEVIFDQGLGDIFVIRVAGNIATDENIGSIEYAVEHLGTPLVMVLGHEKCGAVKAATQEEATHNHIDSILTKLQPVVEEVKKQNLKSDFVDNVVRQNVVMITDSLKHSEPVLSEMVKSGKISIIGGYYDFDSGNVELIAP